MKTRDIEMVSRVDGQVTTAQLIICGKCGNDTFHCMMIGKHQHIQCTQCDESYCDGSCYEVGKEN